MASAPDSPLGGYIRRQRELQKLSLRQLADLVGISNPYLSRIERGLREPSEKVLDAIARNLESRRRASTSRARAVAASRTTRGRNRPWWRRSAPIAI